MRGFFYSISLGPFRWLFVVIDFAWKQKLKCKTPTCFILAFLFVKPEENTVVKARIQKSSLSRQSVNDRSCESSEQLHPPPLNQMSSRGQKNIFRDFSDLKIKRSDFIS